MEFYIESVSFHTFPSEWREFRSSQSGPIGADLYRRGLRLQSLAKGSAPKKTGALSSSIYLNYKAKWNPEVLVGSRLNYAYYVHEGTRPHVIRAKPGRVMRFRYNGMVVYARKVNHPGQARPRKYLSMHLRTVTR